MANIIGDSNNNNLIGTIDNDLIRGLAGDDILQGLEGNDVLEGGDGNDTLSGQDGNDTLRGGAGNDTLNPGTGIDTVDGGAGTDILTADYTYLNYFNNNNGVYNNSIGIYSRTWTNDRITGYTNIEKFNVIGTAFDDDFLVNVDDTFDAGAGSDILRLDLETATTDVTVNLAQSTNQVNYQNTQVSNFERIGSITTGSGNDSITLGEAASTSNGDVNAGDGDDTLTLDYTNFNYNSYNNGVYNSTYGIYSRTWTNDRMIGYSNVEKFNIKGTGFDDDFTVSAGDTFDGGAGSDILRLNLETATTDVTVNLTQANNQVNGLNTQVSNFERIGNITTGDGNDSIILGVAASTNNGDVYSSGSVDGGAGEDTLTLDYTGLNHGNNSNGVFNNIHGIFSRTWTGDRFIFYSNIEKFNVKGTGFDDDFTVSAGDTFDAGAGSDILRLNLEAATTDVTVNLTQANNQVSAPNTQVSNFERIGSIVTGSGNDTIILGEAASVDRGDVDAGAGNDTLTIDYTSLNWGNSNNGVYNTAEGVYSRTWFWDRIFGYANIEQINITGTAFSDALTGFENNDILNGGGGIDTLAGGQGDDTYVVDVTGDIVTEAAGEGVDLVRSSATAYTLSSNVENLTLIGSANINGTGNTLNNTLTGNSGNNILNGGAGADTLSGGLGNDTYVVDNVSDVVIEATSAGTDLVQTSVSYTLSAEVENLSLTGSAVIDGTGNALNNFITGNAANNILSGSGGNDFLLDLNGGNDTLNGGTGRDTMIGGNGDDTYVVDNIGDMVSEVTFTGVDTVQSSISYTLGDDLENLTLTGGAALTGTGNSLNNVITGNSGANILDGGVGADTLVGGGGNDFYLVDNLSDIVTEAAGGGIDAVQASVSHTLGSNVENLVLTGSANISGTGNALANTITGNSGNNTISGGTGADTMIGGAGNDTYIVDNLNDVVTELSNNGIDTIQASISYTLVAEVENLVLTGTASISGTGNDLNNTLTGNRGNNTLSGGLGEDTMIGGAGNDVYIIDSSGDVVTETAAAGIDRVQSSITYTLGNNVENLTLTGSDAIDGTGNSLSNSIVGNSANNNLFGGDGNDSLDGSGGSDTLTGGAGNDNLLGGDDSDTLIGSNGNDTLTGGTGADFFTYGNGAAFSSANFGFDTIADFNGTELDQIVLSRATFTRLTSAEGSGFSVGSEFATVASDASAATSSALIVYNSTNGKLFYNENGTVAGFGSGQQFVTLSGNPTLSASNFLLQA